MDTGRTPPISAKASAADTRYGPLDAASLDALSECISVEGASELAWYVVRTNPQCEGRARTSLAAAGFASFLPTMRKETRHPRSKAWRTSEYPLLTRYLFVGLEAGREHWGQVRACDGVECLLGVNGLPLRVPSREIEALFDAQAKGLFDQTRRSSVKRPYRLADPVMITEGPFQGFHGSVNNYHGKRMVEVMIEIFGRLTPVTVDMGVVRAA